MIRRKGRRALPAPLLIVRNEPRRIAMSSIKSVSIGTLEQSAPGVDPIAHRIDRRVDEDKLRTTERSLHELTETIPQMLWSADRFGAIDYCNQRVLDYTRLPAEQVQSVGWMKTVHEDDVERMRLAWKAAVSSGEPFQFEFRWL